MIKVVVADDEKKICQLICALVDWNDFDMEVVGIAHDGVAVLEMVKNIKPDLVITDIRMPGYDGLQMIALAKIMHKDLEFLIISGYKHFEYAQTAIKLGVNDYLLKPIKKSELAETLKKVQEKYKTKTNQMTSDEQLQIRLKYNVEKIRTGFFSDFLFKYNSSYDSNDISVESVNENYHLHMQEGLFQIVIIQVDSNNSEFYDRGMEILVQKIDGITGKNLLKNCFDIELYIDYTRVIVAINYEDAKKETIRKNIKEIMDGLLIQKNIFDDVDITIAMGSTQNEIGNIQKSFADAEISVMQRLVNGPGKIFEDCPKAESQQFIDMLLADFSKEMSLAVEVMDEKMIEKSINNLEIRVKERGSITGKEVFKLVKESINIYFVILRNYKLNTDSAKLFQDKFNREADFCSCQDRLFLNMKTALQTTIREVMTEKKQLDIKPIRIAKQYIQNNYMNHLSLEEVSSMAGFSSAYFSSMFKKESGQNFVEYISEIRMNKAKELLKNTDLSITVICEKVGYSDIKHFTQSFKKYTGLKPNEFRKLYSWAGGE
ncbi:MAG: helix-turn-helix domain-containing protein [Proteocatella sp.]